VEYLRCHPEVVFAYPFGGLARGGPQPMSDVDIAVFLAEARRATEVKAELLGKLSGFLGTDEIDLVVVNAGENVPLVGGILKTSKVIVDKDPFARHRFESLAWRKLFDFEPRELQILQAKVMRKQAKRVKD
jgi:hypothetical protein